MTYERGKNLAFFWNSFEVNYTTILSHIPIPWTFARSVRNSASWIRWAPDIISSPLINMSYELDFF
jgi:hypothetical protein